jgi:hypothetical protein
MMTAMQVWTCETGDKTRRVTYHAQNRRFAGGIGARKEIDVCMGAAKLNVVRNEIRDSAGHARVSQLVEFDDGPLAVLEYWAAGWRPEARRRLGQADETVELRNDLDRRKPGIVINVEPGKEPRIDFFHDLGVRLLRFLQVPDELSNLGGVVTSDLLCSRHLLPVRRHLGYFDWHLQLVDLFANVLVADGR